MYNYPKSIATAIWYRRRSYMQLYHGSEKIIYMPAFGFGNTTNDYGRGFYCTENVEIAKEWACKNNNDGFVTKYEIDLEELSVLRLNEEPYNILNWLALLTRFRGYWQKKSLAEQAKDFLQENYLPDISGYDVIIGYRADDSYFSFAQDFVMGTISLRKLSEAMYLGKLGEQVVLKSKMAFEAINYLEYESVSAEEYYTQKVARDLSARREYANTKGKPDGVDDIYMLDIMRGIDDDRLRI